ncbi:MAG: hypothetical protein HIU83_15930 [Proteobacteria bacterium]|nr:hypothetical protein [Pseudomonadota bacterium]
MGFDGITPEISLVLSPNSFSIYVGNKNWRGGGDCLDEFDILERRDPVTREYYCDFCIEPVRYKFRRELWVAHSFEKLLVWMDENFKPGKLLCLYAGDNKWIGNADIKDESELAEVMETRSDFYYAVPVVKPKGERVYVRK